MIADVCTATIWAGLLSKARRCLRRGSHPALARGGPGRSALPGHAESSGEGVGVVAAGDLAVVAGVDRGRSADLRVEAEADHGGVAQRLRPVDGEAHRRRAGKGGRHGPRRVGIFMRPA